MESPPNANVTQVVDPTTDSYLNAERIVTFGRFCSSVGGVGALGGCGPAEDAHDAVGVGAEDRLPVRHDRPAHRLAVQVLVGHRVRVGRDLDGEPAAVGGPGEQPLLHVVDWDGSGVVVGDPVLLLGAPVPGVPSLRLLDGA